MVNLSVFRDRNYSIGTLLTGLIGACMFSAITMVPLFLQIVLGYSAQTSGLATTPRGVGSLVAMPLVGVLIAYMDSRWLVLAGTGLFALSSYLFGNLNLDIAMGNIVFVNVIQGLGIGCTHGAVDDALDGDAAKRADWQGHRPVQSHAESRGQHRHLADDHLSGSGRSGAPSRDGGASDAVRFRLPATAGRHPGGSDAPHRRAPGPATGLRSASGNHAPAGDLGAFLDVFRWIALFIAAYAPVALLMNKAATRRRAGGPPV